MRGLSFKKTHETKSGGVPKARSKPGMSRAAARKANRSPELHACGQAEPTRMLLRLWVTKAKVLRACQCGLSLGVPVKCERARGGIAKDHVQIGSIRKSRERALSATPMGCSATLKSQC